MYPGFPFARTHPDHLATLARASGIPAADPDACRVVELACGDGMNVIAMAAASAGVEVAGVDVDGDAIARGREVAGALGLAADLRVGDLLDGVDAEPADFVICHGLYTWVPPRVADAALAAMGTLLRPHGVGFLSFNLLPGWAVRRGLAPALARHRAHDRLGSLRFDAADPYGALMTAEQERLQGLAEPVLTQDDLGPHTTAAWHADVVDHAAHHGLRVLCDAHPDAPPPEPVDDLVSGRPYRELLLVRAEAEAGPPLDSSVRARHAATPGERPLAFALARLQAERGDDVTTLRHTRLRITDPIGRALLIACDGTRDRAALADATGLSPADLDSALTRLADLALLLPGAPPPRGG